MNTQLVNKTVDLCNEVDAMEKHPMYVESELFDDKRVFNFLMEMGDKESEIFKNMDLMTKEEVKTYALRVNFS